MYILVIQLELSLMDAFSLKDKRAVIKSLIAKIQNRFNVSIAEVDALDNISTAILGISSVANDPQFLNQIANKIENYIEETEPGRLTNFDFRIPAIEEIG